MVHRILVIEDDPAIGRLLVQHLATPEIQVELSRDGATGLKVAASQYWDLFIVDRMLPDMDGIRVCHGLRARSASAPVIFLTARDSEADRVEGLDAGADDYLGKPFRMEELKARVRAQLRRGAALATNSIGNREEAPLEAGAIRIDPRTRTVTRGGEPISLTAREFQLLHHLVRNLDRAWSRDQLLQRVWGSGYEGYAHTVNSHINRLRAKLELDPSLPRYIVTVWGTGYRFSVN